MDGHTITMAGLIGSMAVPLVLLALMFIKSGKKKTS